MQFERLLIEAQNFAGTEPFQQVIFISCKKSWQPAALAACISQHLHCIVLFDCINTEVAIKSGVNVSQSYEENLTRLKTEDPDLVSLNEFAHQHFGGNPNYIKKALEKT